MTNSDFKAVLAAASEPIDPTTPEFDAAVAMMAYHFGDPKAWDNPAIDPAWRDVFLKYAIVALRHAGLRENSQQEKAA